MSGDTLWVLQNNLISRDEYSKTKNSLIELETEYQDIEIIPFVEMLPYVKKAKHYIFQGTTSLIQRCYNNEIYREHIFFDSEKFKYDNLSLYGSLLLNNDYRLIRSYELKDCFQESHIFIRPTNDSKSFNGCVISENDVDSIILENPDESFIVSSTKEIVGEWRFVVVDKEIITGSQYRKYGKLYTDSSYPKEAIKTIEKAINIWTPNDDAFVIDIGLCDNEYKVVEVGCFNAAGFYQCDRDKIIRSINDLYKE